MKKSTWSVLSFMLILGLFASALVPLPALAAATGTLVAITQDTSKNQIAAPIYVDNAQKGTGKVALKATVGRHEVKFGELDGYTISSPKSGKQNVQVKAGKPTQVTAIYKKSSPVGVGDDTAPTTTASPAGGTATSAQSVILSCTDNTNGTGCGATYYTTDGTTPTTSSSVYSAPISISATTTLKFFSKDVAGNQEAVKTETYTITLMVTDIDGNVYNTVTIGAQVWMKENIKVTKYRNGDAIPTTTPATLDISGETSPAYQWAYNADESNVATYGRLYTWHAATDSRGLCPAGWHLPSDSEWTTLTDYLGGPSSNVWLIAVVGGKMKEAGTSHWNNPNTEADNSSGFTALPGGYRISYDDRFTNFGLSGSWWSATEMLRTHGAVICTGLGVMRAVAATIRTTGLAFAVSRIDYKGRYQGAGGSCRSQLTICNLRLAIGTLLETKRLRVLECWMLKTK